jgi:glucokinase
VELVAVDIGGTHASFAIADVDHGRVTSLGDATTLCTTHASLQVAWEAFAGRLGRSLPRGTALALACPVMGDVLKLTNNPWTVRPAQIGDRLGVDRVTLINDFGAVAHAVVNVESEHLRHLCGPDLPLPKQGVITILGPGTGLGVAHVLRHEDRNHVIECEGGHIDYAPLDSIEDAILARLRERYRRVSVERLSLVLGCQTSTRRWRRSRVGRSRPWRPWMRRRSGLQPYRMRTDWRPRPSTASACHLAASPPTSRSRRARRPSSSPVGLGQRLVGVLPRSGFAGRFTAKGRFEQMMETVPVKVITHPQPGLFGVAAAFAEEHSR